MRILVDGSMCGLHPAAPPSAPHSRLHRVAPPGLFSQVLLVRDADAAAVDAAVRDVPQVLSAASRPFEHVALGETTARVREPERRSTTSSP